MLTNILRYGSYFKIVDRASYLFLGLVGVLLLVYSIHVRDSPNAPITIPKPTLAQIDKVRLPLAFEPNLGQFDAQTQFLAHGPGYAFSLNASGALLRSRPSVPRDNGTKAAMALKMRLVDANANAVGRGKSPLPGRVQYFIGADPSQWHEDVPTYSSVEYRGVYPGTDLLYYGDQDRMEFDFMLAPQADPAHIRMTFDGADKMRLNQDGDLLFESGQGDLALKKPVAYQVTGGTRKIIDAAFILENHHAVGFRLGAYDNSKPLVIDPVISYSTYVGSTGDDAAVAVALDSAGNRYITGTVGAADFTQVAAGVKAGGGGISDVFVIVVDPTGTSVLYSAFIGGPDEDVAHGIAIDGDCTNTFNLCNVYVTGETHSPAFPGLPTLDHNIGTLDAFVFKLRNVDKDVNNKDVVSGKLDYTRYLGGTDLDAGLAIAFRTDTTTGSNYLYVGGGTASQGGICASTAGQGDGFIAKLDATTGNLVSTPKCIGGQSYDQITSLAVDSAGSVYFGGITGSTDLPVSAGNGTPFQQVYNGGAYEGFVGKLNGDGSTLNYLTYLGGGGDDYIAAIAIDTNGNAYVTGKTSSNGQTTPSFIPNPLFPTKNPLQAAHAGGKFDAFVTEINPAGTDLIYSTYLGGDGDDQGQGIALGENNEAWVVGSSSSTNLPLQSPLQLQRLGNSDGFISELSSDGATILFSSYAGGTGDDTINGIALGNKGTTNYAFFVGTTSSFDFPRTLNSFQGYVGFGNDAFLTSLTYGEDPSSLSDIAVTMNDKTGPVAVATPVTYTVTITNNGPADATGVTVQDTVTDSVLAGISPSQGFCTHTSSTATCVLDAISANTSAAIAISIIPNAIGRATNSATLVRANQTDTNADNNSVSKVTLVVDTSGGYGGISYPFCLLVLCGFMVRQVYSRSEHKPRPACWKRR